ncbi:MAG: serine/threonine-protein kinase [Nannocystaceae bacterium]
MSTPTEPPTGDEDEAQDEALAAALAAMRPEQHDPFARSMQASVRRSLVGAASEPFRLGRFTILGHLGGGGMGTVFVAYDPDLDRKIALKVLRSGGERGRREVLREGRALARLAHPNVVTVFEIGVQGEHLVVAMEYVEGENLRKWLQTPRSREAILARLIEAGRGLAAAHSVELVHRDFKPDNVMVDAAGRARVVDFGLARLVEESPDEVLATHDASASTASTLGGTPAYMAPERLLGAVGDRRADLYSFCVTAWEALFGARPDASSARDAAAPGAPTWLRRVLQRGLAEDPDERWPTMEALLLALERGRGRRRRLFASAALAGLTALGLTLAGAQRWDESRRTAACEAAGAVIEGAWNDGTRDRVTEAFVATGARYAPRTAALVLPRLDAAADAWAEARTEACMNAEVRRRWSDETLAQARVCLDDQRLEFAALAVEFTRADATTVRKAAQAVALLKPAAACLDEDRLRRAPTRPSDDAAVSRELRLALALAWSIGLAGDPQEALEVASGARARAEAQGRRTLTTAGRVLEGRFLEQLSRFPEAESANSEAYFEAASLGAWAIAAEAATQLSSIVGRRLTRHDEGRVWSRHAALAIGLAGDRDRLAEAHRINNLALIEIDAGAYDEARALLERAVALRVEALGADHPDVGSALSNLGLAYDALGDYAAAKAHHTRVLAIFEQALGPDHPLVALSLNNLAAAHTPMGAYAEARALHERAMAINEEVFGPESLQVARSLTNLADLANITGKRDEAKALYRRALAIQERILGPDHVDLATTVNNLASAYFDGEEYAESKALQERTLALRRAALGPDHPDVALSLMMLANIDDLTGDAAAAEARYDEALAILEAALGPDHPDVALCVVNLASLHLDQGRVAESLLLFERAARVFDALPGKQRPECETHWGVAQAALATGDRVRARAEAQRARDILLEMEDERPELLAEIDRWTADNGFAPLEGAPAKAGDGG